MSAEYVKVGEITAASGLRGDLRIRSFTRPDVEIFDLPGWVLSSVGTPAKIQQPGKASSGPVVVRSGRRQGRHLVVSLQGVDDRDAAEALVGLSITIEADAMPDPDLGQYYWDQLIGLRVQNLEGDDLGIIDHLVETGANDVLVLRSRQESDGESPANKVEETDRERLLPWVDSVVIEVDLEQGQMKVDWDAEF